jgi:hypothetical protein
MHAPATSRMTGSKLEAEKLIVEKADTAEYI